MVLRPRPTRYTLGAALDQIMNFLVKGLVYSPWYIFRFLFGGFNLQVLCIPWKSYCSMNGRNKGTILAIPYIPEIAAVLATIYAFLIFAASAHVPVAYASYGQLTQTGAVRGLGAYPYYAGGWIHSQWQGLGGKNSLNQQVFTLFDTTAFHILKSGCHAQDAVEYTYKNAEKKKESRLTWFFNPYLAYGLRNPAEPNNTQPALVNWGRSEHADVTDACDFLTISRNCMCLGVLPAVWKPDNSTCGKHPDGTDKAFCLDGAATMKLTADIHKTCPHSGQKGRESIDVDGNVVLRGKRLSSDLPGGFNTPVEMEGNWNHKCLNHKGLGTFIDMPKQMTAVAGNGVRNILLMAIIMACCRLGALIKCPGELRKPGSQWINGWWAAMCCWNARGSFKNFLAYSNMEHTPVEDHTYMRYFGRAEYQYFGYQADKVWGELYAFDAYNGVFKKGIQVCTIAFLLNVACSFFSTEAYCNDCTTAAYHGDNLKRIRRREFRRAERNRLLEKGRMSVKINY